MRKTQGEGLKKKKKKNSTIPLQKGNAKNTGEVQKEEI